jgi:hypothetical protein
VTTEPEQPPLHFEFNIPEALSSGSYSNFLGVWHTAHEFTLDFAVTQPANPAQTPDGQSVTRVPCQVVARVKVPPTVLFDFLRTLNENLDQWERTFQSQSPIQPQQPPE